MDAAKKNFRRFQQRANQNLGLADKTDVLTADLHTLEERVGCFVDSLVHSRQKLVDCLRSKSKEENFDKRRKKLVEFHYAQSLLNDAASMRGLHGEGLLGQVLSLYGNGLLSVVDEQVLMELSLEKRVADSMVKYSEELKNVFQQKEKLKNSVLDMDSARSRLSNVLNKGEKCDQLQDELDHYLNKVESSKDLFACELYTLAGKEIDMANAFVLATKLQIDYLKTALKTFEDLLPAMQIKIDHYAKRPVFGCHLSDHLRYTKREISVVLEVCCVALLELGLKEEGLFRISGLSTKIRRLKAAFDIDEIDLTDMEYHPHAIAGTLKMYLRELPDPLMTHNLYSNWIKAVQEEEIELRLKVIKEIMGLLPKENFVNLKYLMRFLAKVAENQQYTKMNSQNLAIVIAPNVLWSPNADGGFSDNTILSSLVDCIISNVDYFFPGDVKYQSSKIGAILNRTGGFAEKALPAYNNFARVQSDETTRSVSPPSDDGSSNSGSFIMTNSHISCKSSTGVLTNDNASLLRRPKHPAPPPPVVGAAPVVENSKIVQKNLSELLQQSALITESPITVENPTTPPRTHRKTMSNDFRAGPLTDKMYSKHSYYLTKDDNEDLRNHRTYSGPSQIDASKNSAGRHHHWSSIKFNNRDDETIDLSTDSHSSMKYKRCSDSSSYNGSKMSSGCDRFAKVLTSSQDKIGNHSTSSYATCVRINDDDNHVPDSTMPIESKSSVSVGVTKSNNAPSSNFPSSDQIKLRRQSSPSRSSVANDSPSSSSINQNQHPCAAPRLSTKKFVSQIENHQTTSQIENNKTNEPSVAEQMAQPTPPRPKPPLPPFKPVGSLGIQNSPVNSSPAASSTRL